MIENREFCYSGKKYENLESEIISDSELRLWASSDSESINIKRLYILRIDQIVRGTHRLSKL